MNQDRKNEIKDYAMRADLVDSSAVLELLEGLDKLELDNAFQLGHLYEARSEIEEAKAKNDRMANALAVLAEVSLCKSCALHNQKIINQIDGITKEKV
jgi:hypothetical protein